MNLAELLVEIHKKTSIIELFKSQSTGFITATDGNDKAGYGKTHFEALIELFEKLNK